MTPVGKMSEPSEHGAELPTKAKPTPLTLGKHRRSCFCFTCSALCHFMSLQHACFECSADVPRGAGGVVLHTALPSVCWRASAVPGWLWLSAPCRSSQQQPMTSDSLLIPPDIFQTCRLALKKNKQIRNK